MNLPTKPHPALSIAWVLISLVSYLFGLYFGFIRHEYARAVFYIVGPIAPDVVDILNKLRRMEE